MKFVYIVVFLVVLVLNLFLVYKSKDDKEQNNSDIERLDNLVQLYHSKLLLQVKNSSDVNLSPQSIIVDIAGKNTLQSVVGNGKLVFRFTELNCMACVEHEIPALIAISKKIGEKNVLILASYERTNVLRILKEKYKLNFYTFNIPINSLSNNEIESLNMPYFFILNKSMVGNKFFIPEKTLPLLTRDYLSSMSENKF